MVIKVLMVAGVALLPLPALALGFRGLRRRGGLGSDLLSDRISYVLLVAARLAVLLLVLALSGVTLVSVVGALIERLAMPALVYVFFFADLLLGALVVLTFGRRDRPSARRRASPAAR